MKLRPLGRTGLYVSEICMGTMTFGGQGAWWKNVGEVDQGNANALVERALAAGVNFIDTADVYSEGLSERILGQALRDLKVPRESVIIATKVRGRTGPGPNTVGLSRNHIMNSVEASLKRLGLDYIDLYQVHGADLVTPIEETMRALDNLVSRGLVRYIGASNMSAWQIMKANGLARQYDYARFETVQSYYTIAGRELERELIPMLTDQQIGLMVWSPLAGGLLSGKFARQAATPNDARRTRAGFPAGQQGTRPRPRRRHQADRRGPWRLGGADRAGVAAAPESRDERDRRRQIDRAARRQSRGDRHPAVGRRAGRAGKGQRADQANIRNGCWIASMAIGCRLPCVDRLRGAQEPLPCIFLCAASAARRSLRRSVSSAMRPLDG